MDFEKDIEEVKRTLSILDEKVGEITRSIRAYVDFQTEKRLEEGFEDFQERLGQRVSSLENRVEMLERGLKAKSVP
jgi:LPS O-antigen subunit length determinant protein (WzzB/FepE family)